jgi:hypothetical protein
MRHLWVTLRSLPELRVLSTARHRQVGRPLGARGRTDVLRSAGWLEGIGLIAFVSARVHAPGAWRMERMNGRVADEPLVYACDSLLPRGQTGSIARHHTKFSMVRSRTKDAVISGRWNAIAIATGHCCYLTRRKGLVNDQDSVTLVLHVASTVVSPHQQTVPTH